MRKVLDVLETVGEGPTAKSHQDFGTEAEVATFKAQIEAKGGRVFEVVVKNALKGDPLVGDKAKSFSVWYVLPAS